MRPARRRSPSAAATASLALGLLLLASCEGSEATGSAERDPAAVPREVRAASVTQVEIPRLAHVTGTLFGDERTTIAAKVSGRVVAVHKDFGDTAAPGEEAGGA